MSRPGLRAAVPGHPLAAAVSLLAPTWRSFAFGWCDLQCFSPLASLPMAVMLQFIDFCLHRCRVAEQAPIRLLGRLLEPIPAVARAEF